VINEDLQHLEEVKFDGQDIQETTFGKVLKETGTPKLIETYDGNGKIRQWRSSTQGRISLDLNTSAPQLPEKDLEKLLEVVHRVFDDFSDRLLSFGFVKGESDPSLSLH
jgi:hypothetical protein